MVAGPRAPEELAALVGVAAVVGNSHKAFAPGIALELMGRPTADAPFAAPQQGQGLIQIQAAQAATGAPPMVWADDRFAHSFLEEAQVVPGAQTRPNLKIQEGCGNRCTFCVIPQTRGWSRSLSAKAVLKQVEGFVAAGAANSCSPGSTSAAGAGIFLIRHTKRAVSTLVVSHPCDRKKSQGWGTVLLWLVSLWLLSLWMVHRGKRWLLWCGKSLSGRRSRGCGSAPSSPWTGTRS